MGYYSEVGLALTQNGVKALHDRLDLMEQSHLKDEIIGLLHYANQHYADDASKAEVWFWDSIKWYDFDPSYYPEIHFMDKFLESLDEDDFRFIRIGEAYDDTEVRGLFVENPFDLELARDITIRAV